MPARPVCRRANGANQRNDKAVGQIVDVDLIGSSYKLGVRLVEGGTVRLSAKDAGATFHIRCSLIEKWSVGDQLTIDLLGQAHIF